MTHGALGMLETILKFQNGPDLEPTHRQPVFSILVLGNKAFCGLLERRVNTGISNSEFGHASVIFGGIKLLL